MPSFMQMLQWNTIRPYIRFAHHIVQAIDLVPRIIFDHEFVWIEKGQGALTVGDATIPYQGGDLLLIPPGTVHKLAGPFDAHEAIHFDWEHHPVTLSALDQPSHELPLGSSVRYKQGSIWVPYPVVFYNVSPEAVAFIDEIVTAFQRDDKYRQLRLQIAMSRLLLRLVLDMEEGQTSYREVMEAPGLRQEEAVEVHAAIVALGNRLMQYVESSDVRFEALAEAMRDIPLGEPQIRRLFKRHFGYTPHMYMTLLCQNKARKLLVESGMTIQDIAFACGYADAKYFSRQFRRIEGVSPAAYRALARMPDGSAVYP